MDGETLDSDVKLYIQIAASDEKMPPPKLTTNFKMMFVQNGIIGNQRPLVGNVN